MSVRVAWLALLCAVVQWACGGEKPDPVSETSCKTADACANDNDCGPGARCSERMCTRLYCLANGSSCDKDIVCKSQSCVSGLSGNVCWLGAVPEGWACDSHECDQGLSCVDGRCRADGSLGVAEACTSAKQCATGLLCRRWPCTGTAKVCGPLVAVNDTCCDDADCEGGLACVSQLCSTPASFEFTPKSFTFNVVQGQPNPPPQVLTVTNSGGTPLEFSAGPPFSSTTWITVDPVGTQTVLGGRSISVAVAVDESLEGATFTGPTLDTVLELRTKLLPAGEVDVPVHFQITVP